LKVAVITLRIAALTGITQVKTTHTGYETIRAGCHHMIRLKGSCVGIVSEKMNMSIASRPAWLIVASRALFQNITLLVGCMPLIKLDQALRTFVLLIT